MSGNFERIWFYVFSDDPKREVGFELSFAKLVINGFTYIMFDPLVSATFNKTIQLQCKQVHKQ